MRIRAVCLCMSTNIRRTSVSSATAGFSSHEGWAVSGPCTHQLLADTLHAVGELCGGYREMYHCSLAHKLSHEWCVPWIVLGCVCECNSSVTRASTSEHIVAYTVKDGAYHPTPFHLRIGFITTVRG